jgi:cytochrome c553
MSLRNQPLSERVFATLVILGLGVFLAGGLAFSLRQERSRTSGVPGARPRLMAVLEGVMAPNVTPAEVAAFRAWTEGGATQAAFGPVETIVANNCASCHGPGGQFPRITGYGELRLLALEGASDGFYTALGGRALHLALIPLTFLVAAGGYLRRTAWVWRRFLLGGCGAAVLFDAAQWWVRQGRPGVPWAPWMASAILAVAMLALITAVLRDLWGSKRI